MAGPDTRFYFTRTSRDLKGSRLHAEVKDGGVKVLIQERLNTYVELRRLGLWTAGKEHRMERKRRMGPILSL